MRKMKKLLALFLCLCTVFTMDDFSLLASAATVQTEDQNVQSADQSGAEDETASDETETVVQEDATSQEMALNYAVIENSYVETPGTQQVLVSLGDGSTAIESAVLHYQRENDNTDYTASNPQIEEDGILFSMDFADTDSTGIYNVTSMDYVVNGVSYSINFADYDMNMQFGVNTQADTSDADGYVTDEDDSEDATGTSGEDYSLDIVSYDEDGNVTSENNIAEAIAKATEENSSDGEDATGDGNVVVVLDPGHGGTDGGAAANGVTEKTVNLAIALACRTELQTYSGVTVYMTRDSDSAEGITANGSTISSSDSIGKRADYANSVGADILVSIHNNSSTNTSANGANVYYPNSNGNATVGAEGSSLASKVLAKLVALGLANGGTHIRNSESGDSYADGSLMDYYGLIRRSKNYGFPAIIVEHAFISNASDAANYLSTSAQLTALGVADATAIAEYFGLSKTASKPSTPKIKAIKALNSTQMRISWGTVSDITGYQVYRSTSKTGTYSRIATVAAGTNVYTDSSVSTGVTYYYKVRAYKKSDGVTGISSYSSIISGKTLKKTSVTSVKSTATGTLQIEWKKVAGATGYRVYRGTTKTGSYTVIKTISGGSTVSYKDTTVKSNVTYYYKIMPLSSIGNGNSSAVMSGWSVKKTAISSVKTVSSTSLKIAWSKVKNATGYQIYRSTSKNGKYTRVKTINSGSVVSFTNTDLVEGTTYYYKVIALNKVNGVTGRGSYSYAVYGKTVAKTGITAIQAKGSNLVLTWKKVSGASGYQIQRSTSKSGTYKTIKTISSGSTVTYTDSSVKTGTTYYYRIQTKNKVNGVSGVSGYCSVVSGKTVAKASISSVKSISSTKLRITWTSVSGATGYQIYRSTSKTGTYTKIKTISSGSTTKYDNKVTTGKTYYYKVRAITTKSGVTNYGSFSSVGYGKSVNSTSIESVRSNTNKKLKITWKKVSGASGYTIIRSTSKTGTYTAIATISSGSTTSYIDASVTTGKTYYYKVRANNKVNGTSGYSQYSAAVGGRTVAKTELTAVTGSSKGLVLKWTEVSKASSYLIYRSTSQKGTYSKIATVSGASTVTYTDTTVSTGTTYYYKIQTTNKVNGNVGYSGSSDVMSGWKVATAKISSVVVASNTSLTVKWGKVSNASGYRIYRSTSKSSGYSKVATISSGSTVSYTDTGLTSGTTYYYKVLSLNKVNGKTGTGSYSTAVGREVNEYEIMGTSTVTVAQMVAYYNTSGKSYPASTYFSKGASTLKAFCQIVYNEAKAEGVKAEVVWAQICLETGFLQFGGDVKADQCNFAGLGATGNGVTGETFASVTLGVRAQVQHLKAYASTDDLKNTCVDNRFKYVTRGTAPYVEWLGIQENPYGVGWATAENYGYTLVAIIKKIQAC